MTSAFQERERLEKENHVLLKRLTTQQEQISTLKQQIGLIRQHTITFILDQMDTLHMQKDTEV